MEIHDRSQEWLEADGLGGFASSTAVGIRTRRYHALLLAAAAPPAARFVLVNGLEVRVETEAGVFPLSSQHYGPDVIHPDGANRIRAFGSEPCPHWEFQLEDGTTVEQEILALHGLPAVLVRWRATGDVRGGRLFVRPLLSGRDFHSLHRENPAFRFEPEDLPGGVRFQPYPDVPAVVLFGGSYRHAPEWYRNFVYEQERARGLDDAEDLASPGELAWDLASGDAYLLFVAGTPGSESLLDGEAPEPARLRGAELRRRARFATPLDRAADAYLVRRGSGSTLIAGYPWFGDWGRDTFLAMRGLCIASERLQESATILSEWAGVVSEGMLPNRFPDRGETPEFNSVDASLWYVIAVHEHLEACRRAGRRVSKRERERLRSAVDAILDGYASGTRFGIGLREDGLLAAGEAGVQLTWMDAKVGDWVVTPRVGKPVEVQALWLNALRVAEGWDERWAPVRERGVASFRERFPNRASGGLYDVVDADHHAGDDDPTFRPNQILAVGGLPWPLLEGAEARRVVDEVERRLWTPLGLRSLAPGEPGYAPRYEGGVRERDGSYHQGTVWPWLIGPFVEAWVRVRGGGEDVMREARRRFLGPLLDHLGAAGLGHISEIADADPPHTPRGCPFQAWSLGELLRLDRAVLTARPGVAPAREE